MIVEIRVPDFIESVQTSKARRKKYYSDVNDLPEKFLNKSGALKPPYEMKKGKLFNRETKEFEISNSRSFGTPKYKSIAGNDIYSNISYFLRDKIVKAIKENFKPHLPKSIDLAYPWQIRCTVFGYPKYANWDIDNLWIYNKCFQDLLVAEGLVPDDNVKYIASSGQITFRPIPLTFTRQMVFEIESLSNVIPESDHNMFGLDIPKAFLSAPPTSNKETFLVERMTKGKANDIFIDMDKKIIGINFGVKKAISGSVKRCLGKVFSQSVQMNMYPAFHKSVFAEHEKIIKSEIVDKGIYVIWI